MADFLTKRSDNYSQWYNDLVIKICLGPSHNIVRYAPNQDDQDGLVDSEPVAGLALKASQQSVSCLRVFHCDCKNAYTVWLEPGLNKTGPCD